MPNVSSGTSTDSVVDSIRRAVSEVFSQALSSSWSAALDTEQAPEGEGNRLCFRLTASGGLSGDAVIQLQTSDALLLAQRFLAEPVDPSSEFDSGRKEAIEELLRQVAGVAATALGARFGEVKLALSAIESPPWPGTMVALVASDPSVAKLRMELRLSAEFLASLASQPGDRASAAASLPPAGDSGEGESEFDRLLGVNLDVSLRFGQSSLTLREVLELGPSSVIELDRHVDEPVDLLVDDLVLARGEVVIVDGNYGIRITEVAEPRARIERV
jgi:flagellar motor switch protein FliN/FliY